MQQTHPIQINTLPLAITFFSNGCIALQAMGTFKEIFDIQPNGEYVVISCEDILISGKQILYNSLTELAYEPELKQWLIEQNMVSPL